MPLVSPFSSSLVFGKVHHVHSLGQTEVTLDLGEGVSLRRSFAIEGFSHHVAHGLADAAMHAMVVLIGSKNVVILKDDPRTLTVSSCRMFLNERVHDVPVPLTTLPGINVPLMEIGPYFRWLADNDYSLIKLKRMLNGK